MGASTVQPPPSSTAALPSPADDSVQLSPSSQKRIGNLADVVLANLTKLGPTNGTPAAHSRNSIEKRLSKLFPMFQTPDHPTYALMIRRAIQELNEEEGSSEESISMFIKAEYQDLPWGHASLLSHHLKKLSECGEIVSASANRYILPFGENDFSVPGQRDKIKRGGWLRSEREKLHRKKDSLSEKENVGVGNRSKQQGLVIQITNPPKKALRSARGTKGKDQSQHQQVQLNKLQELDVTNERRIGVEANEVLHEAHIQECERTEVLVKAREGILQAIEEKKGECQQSRAVQLKEERPQQREIIEDSRPAERENEVIENQAQLCEQPDKDHSQSIVHKDEAHKQIDVVVVEHNPQLQTQDNEAMEEEHTGEDLDGKLVEQNKVEVIKVHDLQNQQYGILGVQLQMLEEEIAGMEELTNHPRRQIESADENAVAQETLIESRNRRTDVCMVQEQPREKKGEILSIVVRPDLLPSFPTLEEVGPSHIIKEKCIELLKRNKEIEGRLMAIFESWNAMESSVHMPRQNLLVEGKDHEALEGQMLTSDIGEIEISTQMCQQEGIHTRVKAPIFNVKKQVELSSSKRPPEVEAAVLQNQSLRETQPKLSDHDLPRSLEVEAEALTTNVTVDKSAGSGSITTGASIDVPLVVGKFKKVQETEISAPKYCAEIFSQQKPPESQSHAAIHAREDAQANEQSQLLTPSYEGKISQIRLPFKEAPALPHAPVDLEHGERRQTPYQLNGERQQDLSVQGHAVVLEAAKFMPPCQTEPQNLGQQQRAKLQPWGQGFLNVKGNGASALRVESMSTHSKQLGPEQHKFPESQTSPVSAFVVGLPAAVHHEQVQNELPREKLLPQGGKLPPSEPSALPLINERENEANKNSRPIRCYGLELFDREAVAPFTFLPKSLQPEQQKRERLSQQKPLQSEKMAITAKMLLLGHQHEQPCELKSIGNRSQQDEPKLQIEETESNHQVSEMNLEILHKAVDIPQQPQHWKSGRHTKRQMLGQQSLLYKNKLRPRSSGPIEGDLGLDRVPAGSLPLNHETPVNAVVQPQIVRQGQPQLKRRGRPPKTMQQGKPEVKRLGRPPKLRVDEDGVVRTSPLDQHHEQSCGPVRGRPCKRKAGDAMNEGILPSSEHAQKRRLGRPPKAKPVLHAGLVDPTAIDKSQRVELPFGATNGQVTGGETIGKPLPELACAPPLAEGEGEMPGVRCMVSWTQSSNLMGEVAASTVVTKSTGQV